MKKVVVFGGGTGLSCLLSGLKLFPLDVTAVITMSDNGSSTGQLKKELDKNKIEIPYIRTPSDKKYTLVIKANSNAALTAGSATVTMPLQKILLQLVLY